jgi:Rv2525c-like, glycoside hydrolase-like domain/Fibronectin type III domain
VTAVAILGVPGAGTAAPEQFGGGVFTGYGFESCNAPSPEALSAWLASPYRAVGVYIGGVNRGCANAQLNADWVAQAIAGGWSLIPTYVGPQAPCVTNARDSSFTAADAQAQGVAAADDAIAQSSGLGLGTGTPIYYDMEAYALKNVSCTQAVQSFVSAWSQELHAHQYVSGVYGSAASTMRDLQALANTAGGPDDVWIADWNGVQSTMGDPYVSDTLWTNHQRIHQYQGGHHESYGGQTLNVDSDYLDARVVAGNAEAGEAGSAASDSATSDDGAATATWPAEAFTDPVEASLTSVTPGATLPGYGSGGYGVQLAVADSLTSQPVTTFSAPLTIAIAPQGQPLAPVYSRNGTTWKRIPILTGGTLAAGARTGYERDPDGSVSIQTTVAGTFALVPDTTRPSPPALLSQRLLGGQLHLSWQGSTDANGPIAGYEVTLTNRPLVSLPAGTHRVAVGNFHPKAPSVYRVVAIDAAGNESEPSKPAVILPAARPKDLPKAIPAWAWRLFDWETGGRHGVRPKAPRIVPGWYWNWQAWRALPFRLR